MNQECTVTDSAPDSTRRIEPEDILRLATIDDARLSPDGSTVAYVLKHSVLAENRYRSAIHLASTAGDGSTRQMTEGTARDTAPRWSPDGRTLAFVSNRSGADQVYVLDLAGGEARQLTSFSRGASSPVWSPDGTRIAVLSTEGNGVDDETRAQPGGYIRYVTRLQYRFDELGYQDERFNHIWIIDVESGQSHRLTWAESSAQSVAWSADSRRIAFSANRVDGVGPGFRSQLYVIDADATQVTGRLDSARRIDVETSSVAGIAWAPAGTRLAFIGQHPEARAGANADVYLVDVDSGESAVLTSDFDRSPGTGSFSDTWGPRDANPLVWRPDGSGVLFTASDKGRVQVFEASTSGGVSTVVDGDRTIAYVTLSRDGSQVAFVAGSFTNPCDVYTCAADGSGEQRMTTINEAVLAELPVQAPELMTFESQDGGFTVDAWLIRPAGFDPQQQYPLVQIIHGGPHSIFGHTFFFDMQLWASEGWNVLFINPRASQGYGEAFATAAIGDWGGGDWIEQETALDLAISKGGVDPERLAVTGLSYGGFMTNWIIGQTNRYRVAVSENSICNFISFYTVSDIGSYWLEKEMEREVWSNINWYMERSPISYVPDMQTPILFLQAETDWRCPVEEGEQLYTALKSRGVPTEMVRFPGESHVQLSAGKPETRLVRRQVTLDWFNRYL